MKKLRFWAIMIFAITLYLAASLSGSSTSELISGKVSDAVKVRAEVLKSITEGAAIIIAGIWTYEVYIKNRYDYPYPKIQQRVKYYSLGNGYNYLSVFVTVSNEGKTKLDLSSGTILVRKVLPLSSSIEKIISKSSVKDIQAGKNVSVDESDKLFIDKSQRVGWTTLGERTWKDNLRGKMHEFEPGQTREIQFDFLFQDDVEVVEVISYFEIKKTGHWEYGTLHDVTLHDEK